jgi:hypothetical protein
MTAKRLSRWNPILVPPSRLEEPAHAAITEAAQVTRTTQDDPTAVLVFHGIGEEVRFETLSRAASLILVEAEERAASGISVVIRSLPKDAAATALEVRAELSWTEADGTERLVHVYEAYWAPLTVGKVTYLETVSFLAASGWNGLRGTVFSGSFGTFQRWLFGQFRSLRITAGTAPLLLLLMTMIGFVAAIIAMAASALAGVAKYAGTGGPSGIFNAASFIYNQIAIPWNTVMSFAVRQVAHAWGCQHDPVWLDRIVFSTKLSLQFWWQGLAAFILWAALIRAAYFVRFFLVQYAGSVVAYLSPYKDSKFDELRHQIQQVGLDAANLVYNGYKLPSGWIPEYKRVVILGHSLGSVIGYDTLNAMINAEAARNPEGYPDSVVGRTKAFITFGSPLDKTAFLFRVQLKVGGDRLDSQGELRETMVSAVQPLIASYEDYRFNRTRTPPGPKWINIWSRRDVISGHLDYYDDPAVAQADPKHVQNRIDHDAWIPIAAHNQYWTKKLLRATVYDELF